MRFILIAILSLAFLFVSVYPSFAQTKRDAVKDSIEAKRAELKDRTASKTAVLKERLLIFKDKKKAERAERINQNLNRINSQRTDQMKKHLDKMAALLERLEGWVSERKDKDTTEAKAAIDKAKASIDTAKTAVDEQSGKDYTLTATSEGKIKDEAKGMRDKLHTDLQAVRKLVVDAKQAVSNAIRVSAKTLGGLKGNGK